MTPESPDALESLVGRIADEFTRRHHRGEGPRVEEYADRYPELAGLLREVLPAIEALSPAAETPCGKETPGGGATVPMPAQVDEYEVLAEIGRGGMGVVYKARHRKLDRVVALKVLRSDGTADLARFRGEAEAVARLQHPNVVQIFEVGEAGGRPLLALEFVAGGTLAERVRGEPQLPRQAAALIRTLARAVAAAHDRGLVHRDLKPSNILLAAGDDTSGPPSAPADRPLPLDSLVPKITDFGLAKRLDEDDGQTQTGAIVGTPGYMAPEQAAAGGPVGPTADIYALGAILYEMVTGRPPFKGPSALETLELVRHTDPTPPAQLQPGCPRDLETICLKCLRKDPAGRYPTAAALADDLQRFLDGNPIHARPVGGVERLGKWIRRRPAVAASLGLGSLAALAVVVLAARLAYSWELEDANRKLGEAVGAKEAAYVVADEARRTAESNHRLADEARAKLDAALERERALHYIHSINLAYREWQANRVDEARRLLDACPDDLRHWEWHYLYRQCHAEMLPIHGHVGAITALAVSPDGKLIAGASFSRVSVPYTADLKVWDATTGKLAVGLDSRAQVTGLAFNADGTLLASGGFDNALRVWDLQTGKERYRIQVGSPVYRVAFSPDGARLAATAGTQIRFFDAATGTDLFTLSGHTGEVRALAFSPDGRRLASGGLDRLVKVWDPDTRMQVFSRSGHTAAISDLAFSPGQDRIVSCGAAVGATLRGEVWLWNAADGKAVRKPMTLPFAVGAAVFTANPGQIACAGDDGGLHFLDAATGRATFVLHGHGAATHKLAVTPDGRRVVTGSPDRAVRVWAVQPAECVEIPVTPPAHVALAVSGDGTRVAWCDYDRFAAHWANRYGLRIAPVPPAAKGSLDVRPTNLVVALAFSPDDRRLARADQYGVDLIDLDSSTVSRVLAEFGVCDLSISPDGRYLATATRHPDVDPQAYVVRELELESTKGLRLPPRQPVPAIKVWHVADGSLVRTLAGQMSVAFSPDGRRLAGGRDKDVVVWDAETGAELRTLAGPTEPVLKVQFAAAGRQVVGFTRHRATVWDAETGRTLGTVDGLDGPALIMPDGRRVVGVHGVGTKSGVKWWDVQLGRELLFLPLPEGSARQLALAVSADGRRVATSFSDLRNVATSKLVLWEAGPP